MLSENIKNIIFVGFGGFLGSVSRYGISKLFQQIGFTALPYSTFTVNIAGSLLLGFVTEMIMNYKSVNAGLALFMTVGICGGFTTFSTFTFENIYLIRDGQYLTALIYILISVIGGLIAFVAGISIAKYVF